MRYLRQSTQVTELIGPFLDKTDGVTEEAGLGGVATEISKAGAAYAAGPVLGTHDSDGWYPIVLTTTHSNTVGPFLVKVHDAATHLPVWVEYHVLEEAVYDAMFAASANAWSGAAGSSIGAANVTQWLGTAAATPTVAGVPEVDVTHYAGSTTDVSTIPASVAAILVDTGTTLDTKIDTIDNFLDTEVADIQARLPAALVGGRIDANMGAISSDVTAADNAEAFFDGTGYAGTGNTIPTVTTVTNQLTAAAIATGVWQDATAGDFTVASSIGKTLYIANVAPGGSGGLFISGSNAGTTTVGALTVTGAFSINGVSNVAQTGDSYAIVNSGTFGNSALKTLIDTLDNLVDTEVADIQSRLPAALTAGGHIKADAFGWRGTAFTGPAYVSATYGVIPTVDIGALSQDDTAADNLENAFDDTAGAVPWTGIIDQGTAQSATSTTIVLRAAAAFADSTLIGSLLMVHGSTQGYWQSRIIRTNTLTDDTATVDAWNVTPSGTITYKIFRGAPLPWNSTWDAEVESEASDALTAYGASTLTAAGIRTAVGLASANLDTQLSTIDDFLDTEVATIVTQTSAASIRTAIGLASANLDTQLSTIDDFLDTEVAGIVTTLSTLLTTAGTESYRADGATGSVFQLLYEINQSIGEASIASVTKTTKKVDGSTTAFTSTLNSATVPTSITRAS